MDAETCENILDTGSLSWVSSLKAEVVMRLLNTAKGLFRGFKSGSKQPEVPSIFDSGMGDWILDLAVLALIALVVGAVIKAAYVAIFQR
jgi:hypothetical protein